MTRKIQILLPLLLFGFSAYLSAQSFIPSSRTVDWTHAGIPGGIPDANWPVYKTLSPSGGSDDSVAIQNAINAAPAGSVIVLNAGTYKLHRSSTVCQGKSDDYARPINRWHCAALDPTRRFCNMEMERTLSVWERPISLPAA
jgi:hypothetical protein